MDRDLGRRRRRLPYLSGCVAASPPCFPISQGGVEYSRIQSGGGGGSGGERSGWRWRYLLRKWMKDSMIGVNGAKSLSFQYDAVSYSQNFDEGSSRNYDNNPTK